LVQSCRRDIWEWTVRNDGIASDVGTYACGSFRVFPFFLLFIKKIDMAHCCYSANTQHLPRCIVKVNERRFGLPMSQHLPHNGVKAKNGQVRLLLQEPCPGFPGLARPSISEVSEAARRLMTDGPGHDVSTCEVTMCREHVGYPGKGGPAPGQPRKH
jgi:hypothetical protein